MIDVSIGAIAKRLATQDNACTAHPIFVVQQRERQTGIDTHKIWGTCCRCGKRRFRRVAANEPRPEPFVCGVCEPPDDDMSGWSLALGGTK